MNTVTYGTGVKDDPWQLKTPPLSSDFLAYREADTLVIVVGKTKLSYQWRALEDATAMLTEAVEWVLLGNADEGKPVKDKTLEAWARSESNPVGGYYGLRKGYRGRFANYVSPVLEMLGHAELEHNARNNRIRAAHA
jgi:hypothetical protein